MHRFLKFILGMKLYVFRTVPPSFIRSFSLYTQQWYMSYRFADSKLSANLCVQRETPDEEWRNCPKHVEFHSKNESEKSVHLVGFIIRKMQQTNLKRMIRCKNFFVHVCVAWLDSVSSLQNLLALMSFALLLLLMTLIMPLLGLQHTLLLTCCLLRLI